MSDFQEGDSLCDVSVVFRKRRPPAESEDPADDEAGSVEGSAAVDPTLTANNLPADLNEGQ